VIEAMSCGTPAIAFDIGGIPDMIQNGVNGYIVKKRSDSEYAKVLLDLVNDPERCAQMSKNCRTIALNKFSLEIQAKRYLDLYYRLVPANGQKTDTLTFSMSHFDREILPDASDIDTDTTISGILKETAGEVLVMREIEFQLIKTIEKRRSRDLQINELMSLLEKTGPECKAISIQIDKLSVLQKESESDFYALQEQIKDLRSMLKEGEPDSYADPE
jgi:hypothetical protein